MLLFGFTALFKFLSRSTWARIITSYFMHVSLRKNARADYTQLAYLKYRFFMQLPLALPPWTHLGQRLESMCRKALYEFSLTQDVSKIAIALSGGKDSLALLFLLKAITGKGFPNWDLCAIHVAGEFSCGAGLAENFLRPICQELGVQFEVCVSEQKRETLECYGCSRERRKLIFDRAKACGAHVIAFGHHRDDSVQTLLMNLLHKAEFAGNLPKVHMEDYGVTIIRPLIYIEESSIVDFAKMYGFSRILCQCPVGAQSLRRKTEVLLQKMEEAFPNARSNLAQAVHTYGSDKALRR